MLRSRQHGLYFANNIFKCILQQKLFCIVSSISASAAYTFLIHSHHGMNVTEDSSWTDTVSVESGWLHSPVSLIRYF